VEKHSKMVASSGPENKEFEKGIMEKFRGNEDGKDRRGGEADSTWAQVKQLQGYEREDCWPYSATALEKARCSNCRDLKIGVKLASEKGRAMQKT
jgi:hypothetical protein